MLALGGCAKEPERAENAPVLIIGDSVLAWNKRSGGTIGDEVTRQTGLIHDNRARPGARLSHRDKVKAAEGFDIRAQYTPGTWDWVVVNGGANDLLGECGCRRCGANLTGMIGANGQGGDIPALVSRIRADGARVILLGYYNSNQRPNPFSRCSDEVSLLNARLAALARGQQGVEFVDARAAIDPANPRHWFIDRVHPSPLGSRRIGALVGAKLQED